MTFMLASQIRSLDVTRTEKFEASAHSAIEPTCTLVQKKHISSLILARSTKD